MQSFKILNRNFEYDPLNRLLSATGRESDTQNQNDYLYADAPEPGSPNANNVNEYEQKYQYDKMGNVLQVKQLGTNAFTRNFTYNTDVNTLQKVETGGASLIQDFTYDDSGNQLTAGSTRHYQWTAANRLLIYRNQTGSSDPTIYAQYDYDAGGNRVSKLVRTGTAGSPIYYRTIYIDGIYEYHRLENGTTYKKSYAHIMDDSSRVASIRVGDVFPDDISDATVYNLEDHLGGTTIRLNSSGNVIDREEYYPFGDSSLRTFSKKQYRYVGKEKDAESGLYYYGARYYSAWTCRFISVDPLAGKYSNLSGYLYAYNNPIIMNDPTGMEGEVAGGKSDNIGGGESTGLKTLEYDSERDAVDGNGLETLEYDYSKHGKNGLELELLSGQEKKSSNNDSKSDKDKQSKGGVRIIVSLSDAADIHDAAQTRIKQITESHPNDKLIYINDNNLGNLKKHVEREIKNAQSEGYGKTVELSVFAHSAADGPIGSYDPNNPKDLYHETGNGLDKGQMAPKHWANIDYNFDKDNSLAAFYGCNTASWAEMFLTKTNVKYSAGIAGKSGGTYSTKGDFKVTYRNFLFPASGVFLRAQEGGKVLPMYLYTKGKYISSPYGKMLEERYIYGNPTIKSK